MNFFVIKLEENVIFDYKFKGPYSIYNRKRRNQTHSEKQYGVLGKLSNILINSKNKYENNTTSNETLKRVSL